MPWTTAHVAILLSIGEHASVTPQEHDALTGMALLTGTTEALLVADAVLLHHWCSEQRFSLDQITYVLNTALDLPFRLLLPPHENIPPGTISAALQTYRLTLHRLTF